MYICQYVYIFFQITFDFDIFNFCRLWNWLHTYGIYKTNTEWQQTSFICVRIFHVFFLLLLSRCLYTLSSSDDIHKYNKIIASPSMIIFTYRIYLYRSITPGWHKGLACTVTDDKFPKTSPTNTFHAQIPSTIVILTVFPVFGIVYSFLFLFSE